MPTPPSSPRPMVSQGTLVVAVVLSLILGTFGGVLGGSMVSGSFDTWFNRMFRGVTTTTENGVTTQKVNVQEESATVDVIKRVKGSVVSIIVTKDLSKIYSQTNNSFPFDFFGIPQSSIPQGKQEVGGGSGFIVSADGYVMTNKHVVADTEAEYTVLTNDGKRYAAKVVAIDPSNDLAVVKIEATGLTPVELGDSSLLDIGQTVIAIGNALGQYRNTVTKGVISGLARRVTAGDGQSAETLEDVIQTDAAINPGNSGGPLLNIAGQVIGVNTAVSQEGQLIGFAIPVSQAKLAFDSVKKSGKIVRSFLGVRYVPVTKALQEQNTLSVDYGVLIQRGNSRTDLAVIAGSPADKAGLAENDIILEIDGKKLNADTSLAGEIQKHAPGDMVTLKVLSKGKEKIVTVKLEELK